MKQHVTVKQLNELSEKGKKKLRKWWKPKRGDKFSNLSWSDEVFYGELSSSTEAESYEPDKVYFKGSEGEGKEQDLPLLSIGQMIEFLEENKEDWINHIVISWEKRVRLGKNYICSALWQATKEILEK